MVNYSESVTILEQSSKSEWIFHKNFYRMLIIFIATMLLSGKYDSSLHLLKGIVGNYPPSYDILINNQEISIYELAEDPLGEEILEALYSACSQLESLGLLDWNAKGIETDIIFVPAHTPIVADSEIDRSIQGLHSNDEDESVIIIRSFKENLLDLTIVAIHEFVHSKGHNERDAFGVETALRFAIYEWVNGSVPRYEPYVNTANNQIVPYNELYSNNDSAVGAESGMAVTLLTEDDFNIIANLAHEIVQRVDAIQSLAEKEQLIQNIDEFERLTPGLLITSRKEEYKLSELINPLSEEAGFDVDSIEEISIPLTGNSLIISPELTLDQFNDFSQNNQDNLDQSSVTIEESASLTGTTNISYQILVDGVIRYTVVFNSEGELHSFVTILPESTIVFRNLGKSEGFETFFNYDHSA